MKVTNSDTAALTGAAQTTQTTAGSGAARGKTAIGQKSSDYAQLSNLSGHLKAMTAEGRHSHLDGIEATVAAGQYRPDAAAVGAKIIEHSMSSHAAA